MRIFPDCGDGAEGVVSCKSIICIDNLIGGARRTALELQCHHLGFEGAPSCNNTFAHQVRLTCQRLNNEQGFETYKHAAIDGSDFA